MASPGSIPSAIDTSINYAIIVAGGMGTRMQAAIPKQFLPLCGKPVLMHTIEAFSASAVRPVIVLVLPQGYHGHWQQLCAEHAFTMPHTLIASGKTRFHSVKNGLGSVAAADDAVIAIHDAVRPLVSRQIIENAFAHAAQYGNAVTAVKSRDSVRLVEGGLSRSLIRDDVYLVQTPQCFRAGVLKNAYLQNYSAKFTDDASVVEATGVEINLVEGSYKNIKITFPEDIAIAGMILKSR